jgi:hypothetical protein
LTLPRTDDLPFVETVEAGPLNSRDVHKNILAAALRLNETIAFGGVEPLHSTFRADETGLANRKWQ